MQVFQAFLHDESALILTAVIQCYGDTRKSPKRVSLLANFIKFAAAVRELVTMQFKKNSDLTL